ncbi:helix-turn-helix domain-containing protein [Nocardia sp. NPDC047648]|uniref:TetR/AcrR family transcriptional regulator n=1 Tax=Nocardia sp. NPDC047648 TaxID=3155625 RepID=UPI0033CC1C67
MTERNPHGRASFVGQQLFCAFSRLERIFGADVSHPRTGLRPSCPRLWLCRPPRTRCLAARPANRRELILSAAAELFFRDGYVGLSMKEVADAVAITPGVLYRDFVGKQDLLQAAASAGLTAVETTLQDQLENLQPNQHHPCEHPARPARHRQLVAHRGPIPP